eukprot:bmy_20660T0
MRTFFAPPRQGTHNLPLPPDSGFLWKSLPTSHQARTPSLSALAPVIVPPPNPVDLCEMLFKCLAGSGARRTLKDSEELSLQCGLNQKALRVGGWDKTCPCVDRALWRRSSISSPILRNSAASQGCPHGDVYVCLTEQLVPCSCILVESLPELKGPVPCLEPENELSLKLRGLKKEQSTHNGIQLSKDIKNGIFLYNLPVQISIQSFQPF